MYSWYESPFLSLIKAIIDGNRVMRQNALLWVLALGVEHQKPLAPMIEALALDERNSYWSARLRELAKNLNGGMPLPDALERTPGLLPFQAVLSIRVGLETGALPAMLRSIAKEFSKEHDDVYSTWKGTVFYLAALLLVLLSVVSFVMVFIIPKFKKIFEDFGTELPAITQWIVRVSDEIAEWLPMIALGGFAALAWLAWKTRYGTTGNLFRGILFSHARGHAPDVLRILSIVVGSGRPLVGAISTMARHHQSAAVRNHLLYLRNEIERGGEVFHELAELGMLKTSESRILEAAGRAGNLSWALKEVAESIERDVNYRSMYVLEILRPAILIAVSLMVGVFAIGMFMPLIKLLNDLS